MYSGAQCSTALLPSHEYADHCGGALSQMPSAAADSERSQLVFATFNIHIDNAPPHHHSDEGENSVLFN